MKIKNVTLAMLMFVGLFSCVPKEETQPPADPTVLNTMNSLVSNEIDAEPATLLPMTSVDFLEESHNFGEVAEGDTVQHVFKFKNTGANALRIASVKESCGCTIPSYSKTDIQPGEEGEINVAFNSKGKRGIQKKTVSVTFENTDPKVKVLSFNCEVLGNE